MREYYFEMGKRKQLFFFKNMHFKTLLVNTTQTSTSILYLLFNHWMVYLYHWVKEEPCLDFRCQGQFLLNSFHCLLFIIFSLAHKRCKEIFYVGLMDVTHPDKHFSSHPVPYVSFAIFKHLTIVCFKFITFDTAKLVSISFLV